MIIPLVLGYAQLEPLSIRRWVERHFDFGNFGEICHNYFLATSWECVLRFIKQEIGWRL